MKALRCPVCRRVGWITRDGLEHHLASEHSHQVLAAELVMRVYPPETAPTSKPLCTKRPYETEAEALRALLSTWQRGGARRCEQRAYQCDRPGCSKWHLTKQPERTEA